MAYTVLIYGAGGHSGRMIAERAIREPLPNVRLILAGRSSLTGLVRELEQSPDLRKLDLQGAPAGLERRVFDLADRPQVIRNLTGVDLVVNAAGPFSLTAERLAKACIEVGSHYVDISGEVDVYMKLDDLALQATASHISLVSSAGHTAGASCLLLDHARGLLTGKKVGAIRVAMSAVPELSRGSAVTGVRLVREQVLIARRGEAMGPDGVPFPSLVKWHEPVGRMERTFDFGDLKRGERETRGRRRMASAANMVDTLVAMEAVQRNPDWRKTVMSIESYLEMDFAARTAYQVSSAFASLMASPLIAAEARFLAGLATTDSPSERPGRQAVVVEIEGTHHERLMELRLCVESGYRFTADLIVEMLKTFAGPKPVRPGWRTPAEVLCPGGENTVQADLLDRLGEFTPPVRP